MKLFGEIVSNPNSTWALQRHLQFCAIGLVKELRTLEGGERDQSDTCLEGDFRRRPLTLITIGSS